MTSICTKPFFSVIIPCHNTSVIDAERFMRQFTRQGIGKDDLQIIVVDDHSTNCDYLQVMRRYDDRLNIQIVESDATIHCPGNSRRFGLTYVEGEWVCFCDHDDYYEDDALRRVKEFIKESGERYCVWTQFQTLNLETNEATVLAYKQAWLHGKFYNIRNLSMFPDLAVNFKKNLVTHEDIYFNSLVQAVLFRINREPAYYDIITYTWVDNPESLSRRITPDRGYMYENFNDYIIAAADPFWLDAACGNDEAKNQIMMTLLHAYFYYESVSYYCGATEYTDTLQFINAFLHKIIAVLGMTADSIINFVYEDPVKYNLVRCDCFMNNGEFIEKTSFRNFVYFLMGELDLRRRKKA